MYPISFKEVNKLYGAGDNPNTDQLPVCIASREVDGWVPSVISRWKLSKEELERINKTGEINLVIMGTRVAPVLLTVADPFTEEQYIPLPIES